MTAAATLMQREVDGLRISAERSATLAKSLARSNPRASKAKNADANLFAQRANVEQDRVDGIRHNILHCTNADDDSETRK